MVIEQRLNPRLVGQVFRQLYKVQEGEGFTS